MSNLRLPSLSIEDEVTWQAQNLERIHRQLAGVRAQEDETLFTEWWAGHFVVLTKSEDQLRLWLLEEELASTTWVQSILQLNDPLRLVLGYTQAMLLALIWQPDPKRIFVSGLGGGSLPLIMHHHFPTVSIDCVEISPAVVEATTTFSALPTDERIRITIADAAEFLSTQPPASYDMLLLDLFTDSGKTPAHLTGVEFFTSCRERLTPSGVLAMNLHSKAEGHAERLQHLQDLFPSVYVCAVHDEVNVVFATAQPRLNRFALIERAIEVHRRRQFHFHLAEWIMKIAI